MLRYLFLALAFCAPMIAEDNAPSAESIDKLLEVSHTKNSIEAIRPHLNAMVKEMMGQLSQDIQLNEKEQKVLDNFQLKATAVLNQELSLEKMKPAIIEIYGKNLSQQDVNGLIAFYDSPAGIAFVSKMPKIVESMMQEMQKQTFGLVDKMSKLLLESQEELAALQQGSEE